jgi:hypothetical protein
VGIKYAWLTAIYLVVVFAIYNYNAGEPSHCWLGFSSTVDCLIVCYNSQANNLTK